MRELLEHTAVGCSTDRLSKQVAGDWEKEKTEEEKELVVCKGE